MEHINALLQQSKNHATILSNKLAVDLAIFFHDIIYDPFSKTNEEDSADLFVETLSPHIDPDLCEKVCQYIIATKKHEVSHMGDNDLKLFIDMDMSILGVEPDQYEKYARQIRQEYQHVPQADYCRGRATVLESFLLQADQSSSVTTGKCGEKTNETPPEARTNTKFIFATEIFRREREEQARMNLQWECEILKTGRLV
jgi:predicted metal-dependent HD superfamily phosphohydrolase